MCAPPAASRALADGVFTSVPVAGFEWSVLLAFGTVLRDGEDASTRRVSSMSPAAPRR
jgi:hypothetical protein